MDGRSMVTVSVIVFVPVAAGYADCLKSARFPTGAVARSAQFLTLPKGPEKPMGGAHKKKGRLRCHKRPKSREETPNWPGVK
jgi:hypothetical protein